MSKKRILLHCEAEYKPGLVSGSFTMAFYIASSEEKTLTAFALMQVLSKRLQICKITKKLFKHIFSFKRI